MELAEFLIRRQGAIFIPSALGCAAASLLGDVSRGKTCRSDVTAARNLLAVGRGRLVGGTPGCHGSGILALPAPCAAAAG